MTLFERIFSWMTKPSVVMVYFLCVVLSYYYLDRSLVIYISSQHMNEHYLFLNGLTLLGENKFFLTGLMLIALFFRWVKKNRVFEERAWFLWLCVVVCNLICLLLKISIGRARPELLLQENIYGFFGFQTHSTYWSLPSGHTTTIMSLAFGLSIIFPRQAAWFLISAFCVALTRILLLQHYLSDVLTATFLTLIEVGVLSLILRRKEYLHHILPSAKMVNSHE